jgi:hypothetical protein
MKSEGTMNNYEDESFEPALEREAVDELRAANHTNERLEDATVRALRARGLLRRGARRPALSTWLAGAAAAAVVFIAGVAVGRQASPGDMTVSPGDPLNVRLSKSALQYIEALAEVQPGDSVMGELALLSLRHAANQVVRIAPESQAATALGFMSQVPTPIADRPGSDMLAQSNLIWY